MTDSTYKAAGVDLEVYQQAMQRLPALLDRTRRPGVMELPGGFAGLFRLADAGSFTDPVLVSGSDGVGTKVKVAIAAGRFDTIGIDLVAMCANDVACLGAAPLFFLDYLALGRDNPDLIVALVDGITNGCVQAGAALLGGETAIMPDLYAEGDFDLAGFCVGVVERERMINGVENVQAGDVIVGVASSGFHSNGYSLIRRIVFEQAGLSVDDRIDELDANLADVLLRPTTIYTDLVTSLNTSLKPGAISALAHITGGGLPENVERVLPEDCRAVIDRSAWTAPPEFCWLDELGGVGSEEMFKVFNMGVGLAVIVRPDAVESVIAAARESELDAWQIGTVHEGQRGVELRT